MPPLTIFSVLLGLVMGSFLNVCIHRIPLGKTLGGRSQCPHCSHLIAWYENIPLLSYLILGGKCRHCHQSITLRYPFVEGLTALLSVLTLHHHTFNLPLYFMWFLLFVCPLIAVIFIDFEHQIIPDIISLPGIAAGALVIFYSSWPLWTYALKFSGLGILVGGGSLLIVAQLYYWTRKREGMGGGDIKLAGMLGAFLGWERAVIVFFLSSLLALLYAVIYMILNRKQKGPLVIPYGPFLSTAALIIHYYGAEIMGWYLRFTGLSL